MEFKDELRKYTERLENIKDTLQTEEATKMILLLLGLLFTVIALPVSNKKDSSPEVKSSSFFSASWI